jgi:RNA polymerase sigma-70 factor (ECF subfamily)
VALPDSAPSPGVEENQGAHLRRVFEGEFDYVWTSLGRLGVATRDREDVAQDVFLRVFRHLEQYDPARPIRPWLFAFVFRCASDWRRLARHRVEILGEHPESASPTHQADEAMARAQDRRLVDRALQQIEVKRRAVFILHELDQCPMKDIAESLGIPLFTAYSRLRVGRVEFAAAARRLLGREGKS